MGWGKISAVLGGVVLVITAWAAIVKFDYRPVLKIEVTAQAQELDKKIDNTTQQLSGQIDQAIQQNIVTKSLVLNDRLFSTEQRINLKLEQINEHRSKGVAVPQWLTDDWLMLEAQKKQIVDELDGIKDAPLKTP